MYFADGLIVDRTWETADGFLGFSARFARTGVQMYRGDEIDPDGIHKDAAGARRFNADTLYPVDRPAEEVFAPRAMASFIAKPITNDHPANGVTIDNWKDLTKGVIGEVLRDGEFARMSGLITDKQAIADYRSGKKELSGGYGAAIVVRDGTNPKGEAYVAQQADIGGNHCALVKYGRAGSECAIHDALPDSIDLPQSFLDSFKEKPVSRTLTVDGLPVNVADADAATATINRLLEQRDAATGKVVTLETAAVTDAAMIVAKDAEITKLTTDLAAAKLTPAQMRDAGKAYAIVAGKAKAMGVTVTDAMDEGAIMRAVVDKSMGDKAKGYSDDHVAIAFDALTKDAKVQDADPLRDAITNQPVNVGDAANDRQKALDARRTRNATGYLNRTADAA